MRARIAVLALLLSCVTRPCGVAAAQARGVTPDDYLAFETPGDPHFSPDGRTIVYTVSHVDVKQNRRVSQIWTVAADGSSTPRQLHPGPEWASQPRWRPDGRAIAFVSSRREAGAPEGNAAKPQVWLLPLDGGTPKRLASLQNGANTDQWSPEGSRLVVASASGPSDSVRPASDVRHFAHANYKFNDTGWFDDKRTHLWVVDATSGASTQITSGDDWNDSDPQWSPDGSRIAFVSDRTGKAFDMGHNTDVWVIAAAGGPLTKISDHPGGDTSPRWSPDGQTIAFLSAVPEKSHPKIWLAPFHSASNVAQGRPATPPASKLAADNVDLIPSGLRWAADGRALF